MKKGERLYQWHNPQTGRRDGERCVCYGKHPSISAGTNFERLRHWGEFLYLHVLLNANYAHETAKMIVSEVFGITRPDTLAQWVQWILEFAHVYVWNHCPTQIGDTPGLKQISIDESFWQRARISKNMKPRESQGEPLWI